MNPKVTDLSHRLALHDSARPFLVMLGAGPAIRNALRTVLAKLPKDQQRALMTVVAFRLMGGQLPANVTLLEHLPSLAGMHDQTIAAAFQMLVDGGILGVNQPKDEKDPAKRIRSMTFYWPELEHLFGGALERENSPDPTDPPVL